MKIPDNEPTAQELMECHEIKPGMVFDGPGNHLWKVSDKDGSAERHNRYHCDPLDGSETMVLCFDRVFLKTKYNFRFPDEDSRPLLH